MSVIVNAHQIDRPIVVVADYREDDDDIGLATNDLDLYTQAELREILDALNAVCRKVTVYSSPQEFIDSIHAESNALILPFWAGRVSRNRTALVSAIAEAYGMTFFGADVYAYIVCQDKSLSKQVARDLGIRTPASVLIRSLEQLDLAHLVELPCVVKPNLQGSSIGIGQKNLCNDVTEAKEVAADLLAQFDQPVLVEHFLEGLEVTVTIFGNKTNIELFQAVEIFEPTGRIDFSKTIWSYEMKKASHRPQKAQRPISLTPSDEDRLRELFSTMGKLDLVRIDGRLCSGEFHFLEMNPEPYLARIGSVAKSFELHGHSYEEMFRCLLLPFDIHP